MESVMELLKKQWKKNRDNAMFYEVVENPSFWQPLQDMVLAGSSQEEILAYFEDATKRGALVTSATREAEE